MSAALARLSPAVLRVGPYRQIWLGNLASNAGTWLQIVAAAFLVYEITESPAAVGVLALIARGPSVVFAPLSGQLADRYDRRTVALATFAAQAAAAAALAILAALGLAGVAVIYVLTFVLWTGWALGLPAMLALIPLLVERPLFSQAVSVNAAGINVARLIGPAIGGVMLAFAGPAWCFALNAASFAVLLVALTRIAPRPSANGGAPTSTRAGVRAAGADPALRRLLVGAAVFTLLAGPIQELAAVIAADLSAGEIGLGALLSAMGGGGLVGAFVLEWLQRRGLTRSRSLPAASAMFAVGLGLLAVSPWLALSITAMAFCGVFWIWIFAGTNTAIQLRAPERLVGQMLGLYQMAVVGGIGVGSLLAGLIAEEIGIRPTLGLLAALLAAWGVWSLVNRVTEIDVHRT